MRLTRRQTCLGITALSAMPRAAWAHRENATRSVISWDTAGSYLDITHTYHLHDAATTLNQNGILDTPDLLSLKQRARLALYTEAHFKLYTQDKTPISLSLLGADISGSAAFVYQQVQLNEAPKALAVDCRLLRPLVIDQRNHVDWHKSGKVISQTFLRDDGIKMMLA